MYDPSGCSDTTGEWIELFNAGSTPVAIGGWRLMDGSSSAVELAAVTLAPGAYHIAARGSCGVAPDQTFAFALNNDGDTLTLTDAAGAVADTVTWRAGASSPGRSIERVSGSARRPDRAQGKDAWRPGPEGGTPRAGYAPDCADPADCARPPRSASNPADRAKPSATSAKTSQPAGLGAHSLKLMSYNVGFGGRDPAWKRVFEQENPDIAVLVEVGTWDDRRDALLDQYVAEFNAHFAGQPPYRGDVAQNTPRVNTGLALLSRYPIVEVTQLSRVTLDDGTEFDPTHDLMIWTVDAGGERIRVVGVYLKCCGGPANRDIRDRTMEGLINALDALGDVPLILMGDFNSFSPRDTGPLAPSGNLAAGPLSMLLSPRDPTYGGRASAVHAFTDAFRALAPDAPGYTYGHRSRKYKSRIDFILVNQHLADRLAGPATVGDTEAARAGSDHFSVDVRLSLGAGATAAR